MVDDLREFPEYWPDERVVSVLTVEADVDLLDPLTVVPVDCLVSVDPDTDLLPLLLPDDATDDLVGLSGWLFKNSASPSLLESGCE